jgi:hypothetical protein
MAISRTPMIDDDGSGMTGTILNNAWKTELYNQIDGLVSGSLQSFIVTDASGAGLVFPNGFGNYVVLAKTVFVMIHLVYPATADPTAALIGGLPFASHAYPPYGGLFQCFGVSKNWWINGNVTTIQPQNPTTGGQMTNAQMSGSNNVLLGFYQVP